MSLVFKSYDPMRDQQRAELRRQKRSAERLTLVPSSATCINTPPSQSLVTGHKSSRIDEKFIPLTNTDRTEDPYSGFPSVEECLEFCSPQDTNVPSAYTPTSANSLSYPDSAIDTQDVSSESSCQEEAYKDDQLRRKPLASDSNIGREAHNANTSYTPVSTTVSVWESAIGISPAEHVWSSDAEILSSIASSISTPPLATSPTYLKQTSTWRNQDSVVDSEDGAQMADLGVPDDISKNALSGVGLPIVESEDNIAPEPSSTDSSDRLLNQDIQVLPVLASTASTMEESVMKSSVAEPSVTEPCITEPGSAGKSPAQDIASSSTKRSFSESGATSDSQPSSSEVCHSSKRLRFTQRQLPLMKSMLLDIQKMISSVLAKFDHDPPRGLLPDGSSQSTPGTIRVAAEHIDDETSDDSSSASSISGGSDSEPGPTPLQRRGIQHKSTQRRRWTREEEKVLRRLKSTQNRNKGLPSDCEIASRLGRSENGVKQHWDIMLQKNRRGC